MNIERNYGIKKSAKLTNIKRLNFKSRATSRPQYDSFDPTYDSFTGLKDKNSLLIDLGRKMYEKKDISMGMFDMDNFKSINELLGYKTGDEFIKAISNDISTVAKKHNINAYRFGGDEFVVLLFSGVPKDKKLEVIEDIISTTSKNPIIQNRASDYIEATKYRLTVYEESNNKIKQLLSLNTKKEILYDIYDNSTIAKNDLYVQQKLVEVDNNLQEVYSRLISECLTTETDLNYRKLLKNGIASPMLNEYLIAKYDRNPEIYRIKKWMKDFNQNGFNLTGGVATFKSSYYKNKLPIDLINEIGEHLKESKLNKRNLYYVELK